jgi:hypothetical protein
MQIIKKASFSLSATYSNGNFTHNLIGKNAYFDVWLNTCEFMFDLTGNFRIRNKYDHSYLDINEMNEQRDKLWTVQIFDSSIASTIKEKIVENDSMEFRATFLMDTYPKILCKINSFTFDDSVSTVTLRIGKILQL